jgi:hypothetical protein
MTTPFELNRQTDNFEKRDEFPITFTYLLLFEISKDFNSF